MQYELNQCGAGYVYPYHDNDRPEIRKLIPAGCMRCLDVGCGRGAFGYALKRERSMEVWGVEPVSDVAALAEAKLDRVVRGRFGEQLALPGRFFDVVTLLDVLEHMEDPWDALRVVRDVLAPSGYVVASVPNIRYWPVLRQVLFEGDWRYAATGVLDRTHLRFFTKRSLLRMFADAGYYVCHIEGINPMRWRRLAVFSKMLGGRVADMQFAQFAVVSRVAGAR